VADQTLRDAKSVAADIRHYMKKSRIARSSPFRNTTQSRSTSDAIEPRFDAGQPTDVDDSMLMQAPPL